jgi:hypothetical protein
MYAYILVAVAVAVAAAAAAAVAAAAACQLQKSYCVPPTMWRQECEDSHALRAMM